MKKLLNQICVMSLVMSLGSVVFGSDADKNKENFLLPYECGDDKQNPLNVQKQLVIDRIMQSLATHQHTKDALSELFGHYDETKKIFDYLDTTTIPFVYDIWKKKQKNVLRSGFLDLKYGPYILIFPAWNDKDKDLKTQKINEEFKRLAQSVKAAFDKGYQTFATVLQNGGHYYTLFVVKEGHNVHVYLLNSSGNGGHEDAAESDEMNIAVQKYFITELRTLRYQVQYEYQYTGIQISSVSCGLWASRMALNLVDLEEHSKEFLNTIIKSYKGTDSHGENIEREMSQEIVREILTQAQLDPDRINKILDELFSLSSSSASSSFASASSASAAASTTHHKVDQYDDLINTLVRRTMRAVSGKRFWQDAQTTITDKVSEEERSSVWEKLTAAVFQYPEINKQNNGIDILSALPEENPFPSSLKK